MDVDLAYVLLRDEVLLAATDALGDLASIVRVFGSAEEAVAHVRWGENPVLLVGVDDDVLQGPTAVALLRRIPSLLLVAVSADRTTDPDVECDGFRAFEPAWRASPDDTASVGFDAFVVPPGDADELRRLVVAHRERPPDPVVRWD